MPGLDLNITSLAELQKTCITEGEGDALKCADSSTAVKPPRLINKDAGRRVRAIQRALRDAHADGDLQAAAPGIKQVAITQ